MMREITHVVVHHSYSEDGGTTFNSLAIRRYHMETKGWHDVGYHFLVEMVNGEPQIIGGRPMREPGAHCRELNMNNCSIGICVIGSYDAAPPPEAIWNKAVSLIQDQMMTFGIPAANVIGHREVGLMAGFDWTKGQFKTCPGRSFDMEKLRADCALI